MFPLIYENAAEKKNKKNYGKMYFISIETPIDSEVEWDVDNQSYY